MSWRCTEPCKYQAACGLWVLFPGGCAPAPCGASVGLGETRGCWGPGNRAGDGDLSPRLLGWAGRGKGGGVFVLLGVLWDSPGTGSGLQAARGSCCQCPRAGAVLAVLPGLGMLPAPF